MFFYSLAIFLLHGFHLVRDHRMRSARWITLFTLLVWIVLFFPHMIWNVLYYAKVFVLSQISYRYVSKNVVFSPSLFQYCGATANCKRWPHQSNGKQLESRRGKNAVPLLSAHVMTHCHFCKGTSIYVSLMRAKYPQKKDWTILLVDI